VLSVHRLRQRLQEERTAALNRLHGLLAEGREYASSASAALAGACGALADETLLAALRQCVARQLTHLASSKCTWPTAIAKLHAMRKPTRARSAWRA